MQQIRTRVLPPVCHGPAAEIDDYSAERPFRNWKKLDLLELIETGLSMDPPRLEISTIAFDEFRLHRNRQKSVNEALKIFSRHNLLPISWLAEARAVARGLLPASPDRRKKGRIYAILRWGYNPPKGPYGVYVGSTRKPVEKRFLEHRTGVRSARGLQKNGIEPLYSLFVWANPVSGMKDDLLRWETLLHLALEEPVPRVTGDKVKDYI